jgi:hypothetical protein
MRLAGMVYGLELVYNFGEEMRERRGLAWWFGSAIMLAGLAGWVTGRMLKAAVSRQREHLADARAVQWTRSRDGLGGVLRKVMPSAATPPQATSSVATPGWTIRRCSTCCWSMWGLCAPCSVGWTATPRWTSACSASMAAACSPCR